MRLSIRESSRTQGDGWWVSPDNQVFSVPQAMGSHKEWLSSHLDEVAKFDDTIKENDPEIWNKAFKKGWMRIRIEYDDSDMSKPIASISCLDIGILDTIPSGIKDILAKVDTLEFIDMNNGSTKYFNHEQTLNMLHIARKASLNISKRDNL